MQRRIALPKPALFKNSSKLKGADQQLDEATAVGEGYTICERRLPLDFKILSNAHEAAAFACSEESVPPR